jgi:hypothetical protein
MLPIGCCSLALHSKSGDQAGALSGCNRGNGPRLQRRWTGTDAQICTIACTLSQQHCFFMCSCAVASAWLQNCHLLRQVQSTSDPSTRNTSSQQFTGTSIHLIQIHLQKSYIVGGKIHLTPSGCPSAGLLGRTACARTPTAGLFLRYRPRLFSNNMDRKATCRRWTLPNRSVVGFATRVCVRFPAASYLGRGGDKVVDSSLEGCLLRKSCCADVAGVLTRLRH